jgi:hypothetical protein
VTKFCRFWDQNMGKRLDFLFRFFTSVDSSTRFAIYFWGNFLNFLKFISHNFNFLKTMVPSEFCYIVYKFFLCWFIWRKTKDNLLSFFLHYLCEFYIHFVCEKIYLSRFVYICASSFDHLIWEKTIFQRCIYINLLFEQVVSFIW